MQTSILLWWEYAGIVFKIIITNIIIILITIITNTKPSLDAVLLCTLRNSLKWVRLLQYWNYFIAIIIVIIANVTIIIVTIV